VHILSLRRYASQGLTNGRISALHQVSEGTEPREDSMPFANLTTTQVKT
jgi:hypothetical protein